MRKVTEKIIRVFEEEKVSQAKWAHGDYPVRLATHSIRTRLSHLYPEQEWFCYDLRKVLSQLEQEGKVIKDPESRRGQAVWKLL